MQTIREELKRIGIPVAAACTGGEKGRTARVLVGSGRVLCKEAGGKEQELFAGRDGVAETARIGIPLLVIEALEGGTS